MTALAAETASLAATPTGKPEDHEWVGAATVSLTSKDAQRADLRGSYRAAANTRIDVLEVYCANCRRPFEDVAKSRCEAADSKDHLIGGLPGVRAKRVGHSAPGHDCAALGCNTGKGLAALRQEAARRNGLASDVRQRPAPARPAPVPSYVQVQPVPRATTRAPAPVIALPTAEAQAREAGRILASMRGRKRTPPPGALPLW